MREILFRGKRTDKNEWVYGGYKKFDNGEVFIIAPSPTGNIGDHNYEVIPESVGQFTGLFGKTGKRIFEGDILYLRTNYHIAEKLFGWQKVLVFFGDVSYKIRNAECHVYDMVEETEGFSYQFEIVGNITDNPELLKL
jgi:uncharacterized phage protein (TIGR01671 family)